MDESNDPNDQDFATGEDNFSGFAIVGEPGPELPYFPPGTTIVPNPIAPLTYSLRDYGNVIASRENNASGSTVITYHLNVPIGTTVTPPDALRKIARAVAEKDSTYEYAGVYYCPYCEASQKRWASSLPDEELIKLFPHDADCIVFLARAMVEAMPHVEVKNERVE